MNPEKGGCMIVAALAVALLGWALMHPALFFGLSALLLARGLLALVWR